MSTAASQPEGSNREQYPTLDLTATHHWACGMPLSYVLEMADRCLKQHHEAARSGVMLDPVSSRSGALADTK
ncbi:MAG: hypothetical protein JO300_13180 [Silvibacterium sp.]|nr:hypothetical protein [Silvibacterium sp.]